MASFTPISVREAIDNINANNNGWFLPYVQRPYVWGSRYESEKYICRLFDSILKGYPIGILIIWNTDKEVPYRRFIENYSDGQTAVIVEKELWSREDKWLVYDGQQRLQTLYSCLKSELNGRKLAFNILGAIKTAKLFNAVAGEASVDVDSEQEDDESEIPFQFFDNGETLPRGYISMQQLFIQTNKSRFKKEVATSIELEIKDADEEYESIFDDLWKAFILTDKKALAYFPIEKNWDERQVNDVFQRLNTGGVPLSGADLLLSKIKEVKHDFEELMQNKVRILQSIGGYSFNSNAILQMMHLIITSKLKIDSERIKKEQLKKFPEIADDLYAALESFCKEFMHDAFQINRNSIVPRLQAIYPLVLFCYNKRLKGKKYKDFGAFNIDAMKQYFILSQFNDWNTSTIVTENCKKVLAATDDFPLTEIREYSGNKNRSTVLSIKSFDWCRWFTLKLFSPTKSYCWLNVSGERYEPELDHIFPLKLNSPPVDYAPDVVWNMQPIGGTINVDKLRTHPKKYFELHPDALDQYEFILPLSDPLWEKPNEFIAERKEKMIKWFEDTYKLTVER